MKIRNNLVKIYKKVKSFIQRDKYYRKKILEEMAAIVEIFDANKEMAVALDDAFKRRRKEVMKHPCTHDTNCVRDLVFGRLKWYQKKKVIKQLDDCEYCCYISEDFVNIKRSSEGKIII